MTETIRLAVHDIHPGVTSDEGEDDAWPAIRAKILAADVLIIGTPIWLGQPSSIAKSAMERMDAFPALHLANLFNATPDPALGD